MEKIYLKICRKQTVKLSLKICVIESGRGKCKISPIFNPVRLKLLHSDTGLPNSLHQNQFAEEESETPEWLLDVSWVIRTQPLREMRRSDKRDASSCRNIPRSAAPVEQLCLKSWAWAKPQAGNMIKQNCFNEPVPNSKTNRLYWVQPRLPH